MQRTVAVETEDEPLGRAEAAGDSANDDVDGVAVAVLEPVPGTAPVTLAQTLGHDALDTDMGGRILVHPVLGLFTIGRGRRQHERRPGIFEQCLEAAATNAQRFATQVDAVGGQQIEDHQVGRTGRSESTGVGTFRRHPLQQGGEVESAVTPDHQLTVDDDVTQTGHSRGDLGERLGEVGATARLQVRSGCAEPDEAVAVPLLLVLHPARQGVGAWHGVDGAGEHDLDGWP